MWQGCSDILIKCGGSDRREGRRPERLVQEGHSPALACPVLPLYWRFFIAVKHDRDGSKGTSLQRTGRHVGRTHAARHKRLGFRNSLKCIVSKHRVTQISSPSDRKYFVDHLKDQIPDSNASWVCFKNWLHLRCRMKDVLLKDCFNANWKVQPSCHAWHSCGENQNGNKKK